MIQTIQMPETDLAKIDDENVQQFLTSLNINTNNYFFANRRPTAGQYLLLGAASSFVAANYLIAFNNESIFMFRFSVNFTKKIVTGRMIPISDIKEFAHSKWIFGLIKIKMLLADQTEKITLIINKTKPFKQQGSSLNAFLSIKNN